MTDCDVEKPAFLIPADLWPGDAPALHTQLLEWLSQQGETASVDLGAEGETPSISALQMLVATTRCTKLPSPELGKRATEAMADLTKPQIMKRDTE